MYSNFFFQEKKIFFLLILIEINILTFFSYSQKANKRQQIFVINSPQPPSQSPTKKKPQQSIVITFVSLLSNLGGFQSLGFCYMDILYKTVLIYSDIGVQLSLSPFTRIVIHQTTHLCFACLKNKEHEKFYIETCFL